MITFVELNSGLKTGFNTTREPGLMQPAIYAFLQGFAAI